MGARSPRLENPSCCSLRFRSTKSFTIQRYAEKDFDSWNTLQRISLRVSELPTGRDGSPLDFGGGSELRRKTHPWSLVQTPHGSGDKISQTFSFWRFNYLKPCEPSWFLETQLSDYGVVNHLPHHRTASPLWPSSNARGLPFSIFHDSAEIRAQCPKALRERTWTQKVESEETHRKRENVFWILFDSFVLHVHSWSDKFDICDQWVINCDCLLRKLERNEMKWNDDIEMPDMNIMNRVVTRNDLLQEKKLWIEAPGAKISCDPKPSICCCQGPNGNSSKRAWACRASRGVPLTARKSRRSKTSQLKPPQSYYVYYVLHVFP